MSKPEQAVKLNPLERWLEAGKLYRAIQNALPRHPLGTPVEKILSSGDASPEVKAMYRLMLRLKANNYGLSKPQRKENTK